MRALYAQRMINDGLIDEAGVAALMNQRLERYEAALMGAKEIVAKNPAQHLESARWHNEESEHFTSEIVETGVPGEELNAIGRV